LGTERPTGTAAKITIGVREAGVEEWEDVYPGRAGFGGPLQEDIVGAAVPKMLHLHEEQVQHLWHLP
jgi:hypothetical protein